MASIHERRSVEVPLARAPGYIGNYIRDVESEGRGRIVLTVKVPLERLGFDRCMEVSRTVSVHFPPLLDPQYLGHFTAISWEPEGGGPFPHFSGAIGVETDGTGSACYLTLDGNYDPPLGVVGDAFDAIVGRHIARLTARNLLDEIAIMMEMACSQEPLPLGTNPGGGVADQNADQLQRTSRTSGRHDALNER